MKLETLVWVTLAVALLYACDTYGAELATDCKTKRTEDGLYWSWRQIDGRQCWYRGRPNKPKNELRWPLRPDTTASKEREQPREVHISPVAAPVEEPTIEELLARAYDELREKLLQRR